MSRGSGFAWRAAKWLVFPLYLPFIRGFRGIREFRERVRDYRAAAAASAIDATEFRPQDPVVMKALIATRRNGRLCLLLLALCLCAWTGLCVWRRMPLVSMGTLQFVALMAFGAVEFLRLSFSNWMLRTGKKGFGAFLARGGNLWPR